MVTGPPGGLVCTSRTVADRPVLWSSVVRRDRHADHTLDLGCQLSGEPAQGVPHPGPCGNDDSTRAATTTSWQVLLISPQPQDAKIYGINLTGPVALEEDLLTDMMSHGHSVPGHQVGQLHPLVLQDF